MTSILRRYATPLALGAMLLGGTLAPSTARAERHPVIRQGLRQVNAAINTLQRGDHDFHGHRVAALRALAEAREQLRAALRYDRR